MKTVKLSLVVFAALVIALGLSGTANAFHSGGVAECMGCHNIHDAAASTPLLSMCDISSTCLNCHGATGASGYHIATPSADMPAGIPPGNRTPGGDFGWLKKTYSWIPRGTTSAFSYGDRHGHNIVAGCYDTIYTADATNLIAPGGDMDATQLSCNSCHDNHGKLRRLADGSIVTTGAPIVASGSYHNSVDPLAGPPATAVGVYRLLRGPASTAGSGGKTFSAVFNAVVPATYNRSEAVSPTRTAYGAGIADWCATCHPDMHSATSTKNTHVVNQNLGTTIAANYNAYVGSGNMTGSPTTSFDSIVPFQMDNSVDYAAMKAAATPTVTTGPTSTDRVMCLSCHRAHAAGWDYMTRWNIEPEMIIIAGEWPGTDATSTEAQQPKWSQGRTKAETAKAYNDKAATSYSAYQRALCNKCHAKD